jgi:NAD(P)-dependent dehydrogenase (short-subunit alcohol dehydrogenase family)
VNTSSGAGVKGIAGQAAYCAAKFGMIGLTKAAALDYRTPRQIYQEGPWIFGRSAVPAGCASPLPERARKAGKCSPSPTNPQVPQPTKDLLLTW